ncbi:MAG: alpha-L-arabinofuranosidase [Opitutus sp.]
MNPLTALLPLAAALTLSIASTAHAQVDQVIFSDALQNGWDNWSWATVNVANANPVHSGTRSIAVSAAGYQAIYLHHANFDTTGYVNLSFWIHGGTTGGQTASVAALLNGTAQLPVSIGPIPANTWQQIVIPLSSLGAANRADCSGFWIQENRGVSQSYTLDDIAFTANPVPASVNVTVNASSVLRTVDARHFSINTAIWDSAFDTPTTITLMKDAGIKGLRFPGGSASDDYHWATGKNHSGTTTWATSFDAFAHVATSIGASAVFITVNYGSGTPPEAADWVRYSNVTKAYGFKYWEVGNENYGTWEMDLNPRPNDPVTYANRFRDYFIQMKAVDPSIKVGLPVVVGEDNSANYGDEVVTNPRTGASHSGWTPVVLATLRNLGVTPDFISYHYYPQAPGAEGDAGLLASSGNWAADAADLRQQLTDYLGTPASNIEILCTENNSVYTMPGRQTTSLVNGLYLADSYAQLMRTEFKAMVWWDWRNGDETNNNNSSGLYGWRNYGNYGVVNAAVPSNPSDRYPAYYALKLLQFFARPGDQIVTATSDYVGVSAFAAKRADGSVSVLLINKHPSANLPVNISFSGYTHPATAYVASYGKPQDTGAQTGSGSADVAQTTLATSFPTVAFTTGAYSINAISFAAPVVTPQPPAAPSGTRATTASGSQINVIWTDNSNNETSFVVDRATNATFTSNLVTTSTAANITGLQAMGLKTNTTYYFRVRAGNAAGLSANSNAASARTKNR